MRVCAAVTLSLAVLTGACGSADDAAPSVARVDSAGVEVVTSAVDDRPLDWTFEREFVRGGADEGPEAFYRVRHNLVDADANGRLYLLDAAQARVVVFDRNGEFLRILGGRGEGPGEIASPASVATSPAGVVRVFDYGKGGVVVFDSAGAPLPTEPLDAYPGVDGGRHIGVGAPGLYAASMLRGAPEGQFRFGLQRHLEGDTVTLVDHRFPQPGMVRYTSCGGGLNLPRVFEAGVAWDNHGSTVAAAAGPEYAITLFEGVRSIRRIRAERPPRPATEAMAIAHLGEGFRINFGQGLCVIPPEEMVPQRGFAEVLPWIERVAVSPSGEIWVRRFAVGPDIEGPIDLFDATGAYLGTAPPDTPFPLAFLDADRFAASEIDATDVERVAVYRIRRGGG